MKRISFTVTLLLSLIVFTVACGDKTDHKRDVQGAVLSNNEILDSEENIIEEFDEFLNYKNLTYEKVNSYNNTTFYALMQEFETWIYRLVVEAGNEIELIRMFIGEDYVLSGGGVGNNRGYSITNMEDPLNDVNIIIDTQVVVIKTMIMMQRYLGYFYNDYPYLRLTSRYDFSRPADHVGTFEGTYALDFNWNNTAILTLDSLANIQSCSYVLDDTNCFRLRRDKDSSNANVSEEQQWQELIERLEL